MSAARKKPPTPSGPSIRIRVLADSVVAMGPGKADLLNAIDTHGSISAAGRAMGMSYRRAWLLVSTMNSCFRSPLVTSTKGGAEGGHAELTAMGRAVLSAYRDLANRAHDAFSSLIGDAEPSPQPRRRVPATTRR